MTREKSNLRAPIIEALITARKEKGLSQKQLEQLCGIKQQLIARVETGDTNPQLETLLKILAPLGLTLAVVPAEEQ